MTSLQGKKALVTGSTSGIGKAIAEKFAENGATVILHGSRSIDEGNKMALELASKYNTNVSYLSADLSDPIQIDRIMKETKDVDILVHNAGMQHVASFEDFPVEKMNLIMNVHLIAPMLITQYVLPHMIEQQWGRIIIMGSAHSSTASSHKVPYVTAKHGLHGFSKGLTVDFAHHGITSNEIRPGFVMTPLVDDQIKSIADKQKRTYEDVSTNDFLERHVTGKFTTLEQIADTALFLCSPAADNMSGNSINLEGGWLAGRAVKKQPKQT
jgi:3-hydroxybutyrate dehydrogenase